LLIYFGVRKLRFAQASAQNKKLQKSFHPCHPKENYFLKSFPTKIFKTANTLAKQTENENKKMIRKSQKHTDLTMTVDRRPAYNITNTQQRFRAS